MTGPTYGNGHSGDVELIGMDPKCGGEREGARGRAPEPVSERPDYL